MRWHYLSCLPLRHRALRGVRNWILRRALWPSSLASVPSHGVAMCAQRQRSGAPVRASLLNRLGVPGMGTILWGESPLWNLWRSYMVCTTTTSRGQGPLGDRWSEGSLFANPRVDGQESHRRPSLRVSWPRTTKPTEGGDRVNAAMVWRKIVLLPGETCLPCVGACAGAPSSVMAAPRRQESAASIVVGFAP